MKIWQLLVAIALFGIFAPVLAQSVRIQGKLSKEKGYKSRIKVAPGDSFRVQVTIKTAKNDDLRIRLQFVFGQVSVLENVMQASSRSRLELGSENIHSVENSAVLILKDGHPAKQINGDIFSDEGILFDRGSEYTLEFTSTAH